jgi:hypothetical protein
MRGSLRNASSDEEASRLSDAVTRPSKPYVDMSFGMGEWLPAISMTQHAANKFATGSAPRRGIATGCRPKRVGNTPAAPTTTTYYFGDDPNQLTNHAWFFDNSNSKYQRVGKKLPNP